LTLCGSESIRDPDVHCRSVKQDSKFQGEVAEADVSNKSDNTASQVPPLG